MKKTYISSIPGYSIVLAQEDQLPEILSFLHKFFDKEETMFKSLYANTMVTDEEVKLIAKDHEKLQRGIFEHSPCLVVVHESTKKIVGVNLMILSKNPRLSDESDGVSAIFSKNAPCSKLVQEYFEYLSILSEQVDLYDKFPRAKAALEFYAIAVDKNHRRMGLSVDLTRAGASLAKTYPDVGFVFGVYTSLYSKRSAEKVGMKSISDTDLLTYKNIKVLRQPG
ncbi:hypothetical protein KPH14_010040 [Odynerus spinipes]|uniref:N-acetyltransferase domain-containing protein n=1 Tax=Odynerus spinipes TaxID=1348599 RepID=A0AAD9VSF8_9HYME|nr:hypothetical protein KPH14_010040 [Odynerus spinipes]